jgi:hypothetical protein
MLCLDCLSAPPSSYWNEVVSVSLFVRVTIRFSVSYPNSVTRLPGSVIEMIFAPPRATRVVRENEAFGAWMLSISDDV